MWFRQSFAIPKETLLGWLTDKDDYDKVLQKIADNVKLGPFTATSGVVLPYLLNASTNILDKAVAPGIVRMLLDVLDAKSPKGQRTLVVGMVTSGGVMAGQLAAVCATRPELLDRLDFV